jgi:hypothetical protein
MQGAHTAAESHLKLSSGWSKREEKVLRRMVSSTTRMQSSSTGKMMTRCSLDVRESCRMT